MEKQQLLSEQARLADRGAAEMVLLYISASRGRENWCKCFINLNCVDFSADVVLCLNVLLSCTYILSKPFCTFSF